MKNRSLHEERKLPDRAGAQKWHELPETIKYGDLCFQAERYNDALESYQKALTGPPSSLAPELRARLHYRIASCFVEKSGYRSALDHLDQARKVLPRHLDRIRLAKIYGLRGRVMAETGRYSRAERYLVWAQRLLRRSNEHEELGLVERRLGAVYSRVGRYTEARDCFLSALASYRRIDHQSGEATVLNSLALFYKNQCEYREAVRYLEQARTICERIGFRQTLISININLGIVHFKLSKWELCRENLALAGRLASELGSSQFKVKVALAEGNLALRLQQWEDARALFTEARSLSEQESYARERILADEFMGEWHVARRDPDRALQVLESALKEAVELAPEGDLIHEIKRRMADAERSRSNFPAAVTLAQDAAKRALKLRDRYEEAMALRCLAVCLLELGRPEAKNELSRCLGILEDIGDTYQKGITHLEWAAALSRTEVMVEQSLADCLPHLQRAFGAFLDLDLTGLAAKALIHRATLEAQAGRIEEASSSLAKIQRLGPPAEGSDLREEVEALSRQLHDEFAERWATGGDVLTSLKEIQKVGQGATTPEAALVDLIRMAVTQSGSTRGCIAEWDRGSIQILAVHGWDKADALDLMGRLSSEPIVSSSANRPVWTVDVAEDVRFSPSMRTKTGPLSLVFLPFVLPDQRSGFLYVDKARESREGDYHQGELHLLTLYANMAALSVVQRINSKLRIENEALKRKIAPDTSRFVTANDSLLDSFRLLKKVVDSPVSILITGETGTGKGLMAQVLHDTSNRKDRPFVQINCAALPEQLLESELFGHVKGAFTGATYNKVGLFQEADGGTLFLDEVDKASLSVQAKLLHVMDSKEVRSVGAVRSHQVDTRVICATNTLLRKRIRDGEFLEDLFYRLNDFAVPVPPLRERREDLPLLIDHFIKRFTSQYNRPDTHLSLEAREALMRYGWPGNVRELEKTIRRLVVLSDAEAPISPALLPTEILDGEEVVEEGATLREEIARTEKRVLSRALDANHWNRSQVSRELKISYPSLLKKIKDYGLMPK